MAEETDGTDAERLETLSTDRRKLIGRAIIDGILSTSDVALLALRPADYNQSNGNYTQKGGDHKQGGGDYNQSQSIASIRDQVVNVIREQGQPG